MKFLGTERQYMPLVQFFAETFSVSMKSSYPYEIRAEYLDGVIRARKCQAWFRLKPN